MEQLLGLFDSLEMNELHRAVKKNRLKAVQHLMSNGADVTYAIKGETPLRIATMLNYHAIMEELLKSQSRDKVTKMINDKSSDTGNAALHIAAKNNSFESVNMLLEYGAYYNIMGRSSKYPIELTTDDNIKKLLTDIKEIEMIILRIKSEGLNSKLESCPAENLTAMMYARNSSGYTSLQVALEYSDIYALESIVSFRIANFRCSWKAGFTNLDKLVQYSKAVRLYFSKIKDVLLRDKGDIDWYMIRHHIDKKSIVGLMENTFSFLEAYKEQGDPKLTDQKYLIIIDETLEFFGFQLSDEKKDEKIKKFLDIELPTIVKLLTLSIIAPMLLFMKLVYTTELHEAAKKNNLGLVKKCLTGYPELNEIDNDGCTALDYALKNGNNEMAKILMDFGAEPIKPSDDYK